MRTLGTVLHTVPRDLLVVGAQNVANPGTKVVDRDGRPVGVVTDVIGPVARPYLVVRTRGAADQFVGSTVLAR